MGPGDRNLKILINEFPETKITARGQDIKLVGPGAQIESLREIFEELISMATHKREITSSDLETIIHMSAMSVSSTGTGVLNGVLDEPMDEDIPSAAGSRRGSTRSKLAPASDAGQKVAPIRERARWSEEAAPEVILHTHSGDPVNAKTPGQKEIVRACAANDIVFAIGPAGTGKTFTSVALAVEALKTRKVKKIILARPAVEAGETLGFLPGAIKEKIDPYLRPLYDALEEMVDHDRLEFNLTKNIIEIAPLAYMRGRTLNNAFVILDEAQNATPAQMKMFLTRIGFNSRAIITGDITQTDLPRTTESGLVAMPQILAGIEGIAFVYLDQKDVVRHKLVRNIINAYEAYEKRRGEEENLGTVKSKGDVKKRSAKGDARD